MCRSLMKLHECESTEQVLQESGCELDKIPVDLNMITKSFGVYTSVLDFSNAEKKVEEELNTSIKILGCIFSDGNNLIIGYKDGETVTTNRYIVAHELGHAFHTDLQDGFMHTETCIDGLQTVDDNEMAADEFALELLIPRKALEIMAMNAKNNNSILSSKECAEKFDVSIENMEKMLKKSGIKYIG